MIGRRWVYAQWMVRGALRIALVPGVMWLAFFMLFSAGDRGHLSWVLTPTRVGVIDETGRLAAFAPDHLPWTMWVDASGVVSGTAIDPEPVLHKVQTGALDGALWLDAMTEVDGSARWVTRRRPDPATLAAMSEVARSAALSSRWDQAGVPAWALSTQGTGRLQIITVDGPPLSERQQGDERLMALGALGLPVAVMALMLWMVGACAVPFGWILLTGNGVRMRQPHVHQLVELHLGARAAFEGAMAVALVATSLLASVLGAMAAPLLTALDFAATDAEARWVALGAALIAIAASTSSLALVRTARACTDTLTGPGWVAKFLGTIAELLPLAPLFAAFVAGGLGSARAVLWLPVLGAPLGWSALFDISPLTVGLVVLNGTLTVVGCHRVMCNLTRARDALGELDVRIDGWLLRRMAGVRDEP